MASTATPRRTPGLRTVLAVIGVLGFFLAGVAWAFASPIGGAPDDDYHLPSIWCPMPLEDSGCTLYPSGNTYKVQVPETVGKAAECFKFRPDESAACTATLSDDDYIYTGRVDRGEYPRGYYQFQHLMVGDDVAASVLTMRVVNLLLATIGVVAVAALSGSVERRNMALAIFGSWIPVGIYLLASNNPSTWAISGVFIYASGLLSATKASGWRVYGLMGAATYGALLACTARTDATIYCIIVSVAVFILTPLKKKHWRLLALAAVVSVAALLVFSSVGQSSTFTSVGTGHNAPGFNQLLFDNVIRIPAYIIGFYGLSTGLGWLDVHLYPIAGVASFMVGASLVMLCLRRMHLRKFLAGGMILGAIITIPLAVTLANQQFIVDYQPRYLLPLLAVFFLLGLATRDGRPLPLSRWQLGAAVVLVSVGNSFALHTSIRRYVTGSDILGLGLNHQNEWWWGFGLPPMQLWMLGSLAMFISAAALAIALDRPSTRIVEDELTALD